jgi:hypothetical protein
LEIRAGPTLPLTPASVPSINFEARNWGELIDVSSLKCHQPPCVSNLSEAELEYMIEEFEPPPFPLHSQSVERAVKLTLKLQRPLIFGRSGITPLLEGKSGDSAAVIPAPIAYIKDVVVKKLIAGSRRMGVGR